MNLSGKGASIGKKMNGAEATLNPNAAEFVPSTLKSQAASISIPNASSKFAASTAVTPGKSILDGSQSSVSTNSEEEALKYWYDQLPDDITPDFKFMGKDDTQGITSLSFSNLSLTNVNDVSSYTSSASSGSVLKEQQGSSAHPLNGNGYAKKLGYPVSSYGEYPFPTCFQSSLAKTWEKETVSNDQLLARGGHSFNGNLSPSFLAGMSNEQLSLDNPDVSPVKLLASQFPGFAAESLAQVYFANGGDLNLTIEVLTQFEVDGGLSQTLNSKALSTSDFRALDSPALSLPDYQNGLANLAGGDHQNINPYRSSSKDNTFLFRSFSSVPSRGTTDFAPAVRKTGSQDSSMWKYERNGSSNTSIGSSRSSQVPGSSYNSGQGKGIYGDRQLNRGSACASPVRLETGQALANMYSEVWEEARDHARLRNAYFEQARQAYLIGNKALVKELSIKAQWHNMQMKAARGTAQESICHQRNTDMHGRVRMISLHGLHETEAIHVLKRELALLRSAARSADQRLLVYIRVGTGHHTRGSGTPARLPTAVQRYLLEEEGLSYSVPQPGILRVVIY